MAALSPGLRGRAGLSIELSCARLDDGNVDFSSSLRSGLVAAEMSRLDDELIGGPALVNLPRICFFCRCARPPVR